MNLTESKIFLKALAFSAEKHRFQKRKDKDATPYINHPIQVASTLVEIGEVADLDLLIAALLHDTIEDTQTAPEEISKNFGDTVLQIVLEVTDDKSLSKEERKKQQVVKAAGKSKAARTVKLADKICNVFDIIHHPPGLWTTERKLNYLKWTEEVLDGLLGTNEKLEIKLKELIAQGRATFNDLIIEVAD